jgi:hypothetical protein
MKSKYFLLVWFELCTLRFRTFTYTAHQPVALDSGGMKFKKYIYIVLNWSGKRNVPLKGYPGEEAVLEMVMFDLWDLVSSLKLLI